MLPRSSVGDDDVQCLEPEATMMTYSFRIMIVNPNKKKEFVMAKAQKSCANVLGFDEIKKVILASFPPDIPQPCADKLEFGYIEPGHGLRGKKEWILDDDDMEELLKSKKKKEFTLWCYSQAHSGSKCDSKRGSKRSRSRSPITKPRSSRYDAHVNKMAKVDEIYKKIHEAHGNLYTPEQKRAWAHMIELGKHDSISQPPKKRFFQSQGRSDSTSTSTSHSSVSTSDSTSLSVPAAATPTLVTSPGRRVSIRSECIDQLKKWHSLLDCGAITKEQYDEIQGTILSDVRKL